MPSGHSALAITVLIFQALSYIYLDINSSLDFKETEENANYESCVIRNGIQVFIKPIKLNMCDKFIEYFHKGIIWLYLLAPISRYVIHDHTINQIIVGSLIGLVVSALLFYL